MKKLTTVFLAAALVFAVAGQASAAALETSGEYRGRYWFLSDYNGFKGKAAAATADDSQDFWDQRLRLKMDWQVAEGVKVGARADILETIWQTDAAPVAFPNTNGDPAKEIDFDWAYVAFNWGPTVLSLGKMDVSWGTGMYAQVDNRYRLKITGKANAIGYGFAWDTFYESNDQLVNDDDKGYSAWVTGTFNGWSTGLLGLYRLQEQDPTVSKDAMAFDVFAKGAFGNAKINAEAFYGFGTYDYSGKPDVDASAFLAYVGAFLPLGPVGAGFEVAYATGDDPGTLDKNEGAYFMDYNGPFTSFILFNNFDLDGWNSVYSGGADKGVNNALALKASGTFAASQQLSFMGALVWAKADQTRANQDSDMGVEIDLLAKYALTANVTVQAGFGYLAAGDFYNVDNDPWVGTAHAIVTF
jgi:hypothetical protein